MGQVRIARPEDAAAVAAIYAPYVQDTVISFEEVAPTAAEIRGRIEQTLATYPFLVFEDGGSVLGYAHAGRHKERASYRWSCDVGIYVAAHAHGQGIGRMLYTTLLDILARQGVHMAFAGVTLPNAKSVGLHEAMGFRPIGVFREVGFKFGAWRDVGWWSRVVVPHTPQADPIPFLDLRAEGEFHHNRVLPAT